VLRWVEGQPGCTFSADDDGLYRYGLWTNDFGVVMAVDADELGKASHRTEPAFGVLLTLRYRRKDLLAVNPEDMSLEFVTHQHDMHRAIASADLSAALQRDADAFAQRANREISKHPEKRSEEESQLQEQQKNVQAAIEFVRTNSLVSTQLDSGHSETSGWVFFSARSKWIGEWKKQEEFVLRVPLGNRTVEFPFALPPRQGDLILRRRGSPWNDLARIFGYQESRRLCTPMRRPLKRGFSR
jgi:hypothetical protein